MLTGTVHARNRDGRRLLTGLPRWTSIFAEMDEARWRTAWNLKVHGYINLTREIYGLMAERGRGVIVNVIGTAGNIVQASYIVGVSGSAALVAFTQALGGVSLDRGVRVVGVSPGDVLNERGITFLRQLAAETLGDPERWRERLAGQPGKRAATEEDIAKAVIFVHSDRAGYLRGRGFGGHQCLPS